MVELLFERLIRPWGYFDLMKSDKAYAPSTARYINRYHLVAESISLLLFIPNFSCLATGQCGKDIPFTTLDASMRAILGDTHASALFGRFVIGLSGFRFVGLVRHWKQMWLNHAFNDENNGMVHDMLIRPFVHNKSRRRLRLSKKRTEVRGSLFKTQGNTCRQCWPFVSAHFAANYCHLYVGYLKGYNEGENDDEYLNDTKPLNEEDLRLKKAATIGTALMVINSSRAMVLL